MPLIFVAYMLLLTGVSFRMEILVYATERGKMPYQSWLSKLDRQIRAMINTRLDRVELGLFGDHEFLEKSIWEFKLHFGPGYRIYFSKLKQETAVLLLLGGLKKTQKRDIKKAIDLFEDFKKRYVV